MKIILIRHGETYANVQRIIQGQSEGEFSQLNDNGKEQAKRLGLYFKDEKIDAIYSSDLQRAMDTAREIINYHPNLKIQTDEKLRERYFHNFEGKPLPQDWDWKNLHPKIEKNNEIIKRVKSFLESVYKENENKTIVVVCHGGTKIAFLKIFNNIPAEEYLEIPKLENTSVSIIEQLNENTYKIKKLNCIEHLTK